MTPTAIARIAQLVEKWRNQRDKFGLARGSAEQCADDLEKIIISALSQDAEPVGGFVPVKVLEAFFEDWEFTGGAEERVDKLLNKYRSSPLPVNAEEAAREIVELFDLNCTHGEHGPRHSVMVDEEETVAAIIKRHQLTEGE